ncbi:BLVRB [Branchiostoma lanceolatum]|uniref:BLVRB protein n=1 Tax=Branchiostoma lanceolatum TaxID=7740 RepID=A0A8K0ED10_BRALA|nr:BLVRB [Branchiostoma lanceolatum]
MKLVIVGASGRSGTELAKQALEQGHDVTALVRNEDKMREKVPDEKLKVETVDVTSVESLTPHFKGNDAVVTALGHVGELTDTVTIFSESMKAIVPAMRNANVRRLLTLSAWFTFDDPKEPTPPFILQLLGNVLKDLARMETYIMEECKDLDWTLARFPSLVAGPATELPLIEKENATQVSGVQGKMSRGDVARFVLATLSSDKYKGKAVAVITVQNEK